MPQTFSKLSQMAEEIYDYLKTAGHRIEARDGDGNITTEYDEMERFVSSNPEFVVTIDDETSQLTYTPSKKISDETNEELAKHLRLIASTYDMVWNWESLNKHLTRKSGDNNIEEKSMAEVMEGFGSMTGSSRTSYQALEDNVKIVVKHKKPVNEESRGARSRDIHSIYIQRGDEKFKMQENNLRAARAMARHIHMGGEMFDDVGRSITEMATEQRKLHSFVRYASKAGIVNEENAEIVEMANQNVANIKDTLDKLSGVKTYANAVESLNDMANVEMLEDDVDLESKFTEKRYDARVAEAADSIKRSMARTRRYQAAIEEAIANEDYSGLTSMISENDGVEFTSPQARLGYQVGQMAAITENSVLRNHLMGISKRISGGGKISKFESSTVKKCLSNASQPRAHSGIQSVAESVEAEYEKFLNKFDIF